MTLRDLQDASAFVHRDAKLGGACLECGRVTAGRKPYCYDHVERMPYVVELVKKIARLQALGTRRRRRRCGGRGEQHAA